MNKTTKTVAAAAIALLTLGLAACGSGSDDIDANHAPTPTTDDALAARPKADKVENADKVQKANKSGTATDFVQAFQAVHGDTIDEAVAEMNAAGTASGDFDLDGVASHSATASDLFGKMHDTAVNLPGADSEVGQATIHAYDVCEDAYAFSAETFEDADITDDGFIDTLEVATAKVKDCTSATQDATDVITDVIADA